MSNIKANFSITSYHCIIAIPYNSERFQRQEVVPIFRFNVQFLNLLPYQFEVNLLTSFIPLLSFRCLNFSISQFLNFLISQFPNVSISQFSNFSISWLKHFRYFHPLPSPIEIVPSSKVRKQTKTSGDRNMLRHNCCIEFLCLFVAFFTEGIKTRNTILSMMIDIMELRQFLFSHTPCQYLAGWHQICLHQYQLMPIIEQ